METEEHYRRLERMYREAPVNRIYEPRIEVSHQQAVITASVSETFHHGGQAVHGSVLFKMLDDAAFFTANSVIRDYFVLTTQFDLHFVRPVVSGELRSNGELRFASRTLLVAAATVRNEKGKELAFGTGTFAVSKTPLKNTPGYES